MATASRNNSVLAKPSVPNAGDDTGIFQLPLLLIAIVYQLLMIPALVAFYSVALLAWCGVLFIRVIVKGLMLGVVISSFR